jgi:hypothetical protein
MSTQRTEPRSTPERQRVARWPATIAIEIVIGIALAVVLLAAAWASTSAIHFVYGGY